MASSCYERAGHCDEDGTEEPWFQHYMSGKIAEKCGEHPEVFLQHYKQVRQLCTLNAFLIWLCLMQVCSWHWLTETIRRSLESTQQVPFL